MPYQSEYQKLMTDLKTAIPQRPKLVQEIDGYITQLEISKETAQRQYIETFSKLEKTDYELTTANKRLTDIGNTVKLYELENSALRETVRAHGQLAAVMFS